MELEELISQQEASVVTVLSKVATPVAIGFGKVIIYIYDAYICIYICRHRLQKGAHHIYIYMMKGTRCNTAKLFTVI
jgi:hypothetical protein